MANQLQLRRGSGTPITAGFNTPLAGEPFVSTNGGGFYISTGTTGADYTFIGGTGLLSPADAGVGSRLTLKEETGGGTNFVAWQAPDAINNSYIVSMPAAVGAENEILKISGAPTTGRILGISGVTAGGSGYASGGDAVDIATIGTGTGGTGSGATARVIIKSGAVVAAYLLDPGAGYGTGTGSTLDVGGNTTATVSILEIGSEVQLGWATDAGGSATTLNTRDASAAGQTVSNDFFPTFVDSNNDPNAAAESFYTESNFVVQPDVGLIKVGDGGGITQLSTGTATTNFATEATGTGNTKTVNIGTGAAADSTLTDINIGSTTADQTIDIADGDSGATNTKTVNIARGATSNGAATSAVNIGVSTGAGTTRIYSRDVQIGNEWTGAQTVDIATAATLNTLTKTVNIGTGGVAGSTSNVTIGSTIAGTTVVDSPTLQASNGVITTTNTSGSIFNTTLNGTLNVGNAATTVAFGNAATSLTAGSTATTGNTTTNLAVRAHNQDTNTVNIATGGANGGTVVVNLGSTNATSSTVNINGDLNVTGSTTTINTQDLTVVDKTIIVAKNAADEASADAAGLQVADANYATWFFEDNVITTFAGNTVTEDAWESSVHINLAADKGLFLNGTEVVTYDAATGGNIIINNSIIDGGTYN